MNVSLKQNLQAGTLTVGSWLSFGFTPVCEMMTQAGFDWLVIDMEHTAIGVADQFQLIQVIELAGCVPLVRVGGNDPLLIKRALDAGAHGVIVPMVNTVEDAEAAVRATYYPPKGARGAGLSRAQRYGLGFQEYKSHADRETVLIVQIEHIDAARNLEAILAVDGVDGFIVGPYDLSGSMGHPGDWNHPDVQATLDDISVVVRKGIKPGGFHVVLSNHDEMRRRIEEGYTFIAYGDDMVFLAEKLRDEADFLASLQPSSTN